MLYRIDQVNGQWGRGSKWVLTDSFELLIVVTGSWEVCKVHWLLRSELNIFLITIISVPLADPATWLTSNKISHWTTSANLHSFLCLFTYSDWTTDNDPIPLLYCTHICMTLSHKMRCLYLEICMQNVTQQMFTSRLLQLYYYVAEIKK